MEQEKKPFVPYTTEQKKEFAKQFSKGEIISYRKGQRNAYSHISNTAKRESFFIEGNLKKDGGTYTPPPTQTSSARTAPPQTSAKYSAPPLGEFTVTKVYEPSNKAAKPKK
jgi:hypothetical protein